MRVLVALAVFGALVLLAFGDMNLFGQVAATASVIFGLGNLLLGREPCVDKVNGTGWHPIKPGGTCPCGYWRDRRMEEE